MITVVGRDAAGVMQRLSYSDFYAAAHAAFNAHKTWTELHIQHTRSGVLYCMKRSDESEHSILRVCSSCTQKPSEEFTVAADKARKSHVLTRPNAPPQRETCKMSDAANEKKKPSMDKTFKEKETERIAHDAVVAEQTKKMQGSLGKSAKSSPEGQAAQKKFYEDEAKAASTATEEEQRGSAEMGQRRAEIAAAQKRAAEYTGPKLTFTDARRFALVGVPELSVDYSAEEQDQIQKVNEGLPLVEQCTKSKYVLVSNGAMILKLKPEQIDEKAWKVLETDPKRNPHFGYSSDARRAMRLLGSEWVQVACPLLGAAVDVELKPAGFGVKMPNVQLFTYEMGGQRMNADLNSPKMPLRRFFIQAQMIELVRRFYPKALTKASPLGRSPNSVFPEPFGSKGKSEPMILPLAFISAKTEQVLALVMPTPEWY